MMLSHCKLTYKLASFSLAGLEWVAIQWFNTFWYFGIVFRRETICITLHNVTHIARTKADSL
jgi:hypothetical protein